MEPGKRERRDVRKVHVVFKTHLDIGFTDIAERVKERYLTVFIPKAVEAARELESGGGPERLVWTTGSWLIDEYLRRVNGNALREAEDAILKGTIVWHALPFTTHTELMDAPLADFALSIAARLDARFGKKTMAAKLTDVPGHTLGLVPVLHRAGVRYLHVGVNGASRVPDVPKIFRWRAPDGEEVIVQYSGGYGDTAEVEGLHDALAVVFSSDNMGPPSAAQVLETFADLRARYPGAEVTASTLDAFAGRLLDVRESLPVVTEEIGDTWIHGVGTDPWKVARYRELLRLRNRWLSEGKLDPGFSGGSGNHDAFEAYREFSTALLMIPEHTWGLDFKKHLGDYRNWSVPEFLAARKKNAVDRDAVPGQYGFVDDHARKELGELFPGERRWENRTYSFFESSHAEQRAYLEKAVNALPPELRDEARSSFASLDPVRAGTAAGAEAVEPGDEIVLGRMRVRFSGDGSIYSMKTAAGGRDLVALDSGTYEASADRDSGCGPRPIGTGFGEFRYETFGPEEYAAWHRDYNRNMGENAPWALADFGKPGFEYAVPRPVHGLHAPLARELMILRNDLFDEAVVRAVMPAAGSGFSGTPKRLVIRYRFMKEGAGTVLVTLDWFEKTATRLPEAIWFSFGLSVENPNRWKLVKLGLPLSPLDVVKGGNRGYHAVEEVRYSGADGSCVIRPLDSPLVSPGGRAMLRADQRFADLSGGMHFCLYDNLWGTNFPMWYGEDARFRFEVNHAFV